LADVVDALEQGDVSHTLLNEDVAVEARRGIGPRTVAKDPIAADAGVQHRHRLLIFVQADSQMIRPPVVGVRG
jgi:hypothetical protein